MAISDDPYLSGDALWGDDFGAAEIADWFEDEREAYALELGGAASGPDNYYYTQLNRLHGFRHLPDMRFPRALGLGSAFGAEFLPILGRLQEITIVEPSHSMRSGTLEDVPLTYVDPSPSGDLPFKPESFDLALCFSVLHHIPNVSHVVSELGRVVRPGGWALLREPIVSMGDWRGPRKPGVTQRERGIPRSLLRGFAEEAGFEVMRETLCAFPSTGRLGQRWPKLGFAHPLGVRLDQGLSLATAWNLRYHAESSWQKVRPTATSLVLRRR